jgi:drug/metabolite transporter (DMT)-like permease
LLSPFFNAIAIIIESLLSNNTFKRQTTMIFYVSLMDAVFVPLVFIFGIPTLPSTECLWIYFILGIFDIVYLYPYYTAMKVIDTSIVAALFSLGQVIVPILSFLILGEILNLHQYIGFVIIIMASVALSIKGTKIPKLSRAFWLMVLSSLAISCRIVFVKCVINIDGNWVNMIVYPCLVSGILPFVFLFFKKSRKDITRNFPPYLQKFKIFVFNELLCFLGMVCSVYGLSSLSPVVSSGVSSLQPIYLLIMCCFLSTCYNFALKEKITRRVLMKKLFCFVLIIFGVILVV